MMKRLFYLSILGIFLWIPLTFSNSVNAEEEVVKGEILGCLPCSLHYLEEPIGEPSMEKRITSISRFLSIY